MLLTLLAAAVSITVSPEQPYLEPTPAGLQLNCDFIVRNDGPQPLRLESVQVSVLDANGALMVRRFISANGTSPSIQTVPKREVPPGDFVVVFNPFFAWEPALLPNRMRYEFSLRPVADTQGGEVKEVKSEVSFTPRRWRGTAVLRPPLRGPFIVWDGHDFYSHHRRWDMSHPILKGMGLRSNPARYAHDFSVVDAKGDMYRGTGEAPEDWYGFGVPVMAPAAGRVVAAVNTAPDRGPNKVDWDQVPKNPMLIAGNYVIIDHGQGEYSALFHMQQGTVAVKAGDRVRSGQVIGRMGFSGDAFTVHLHYQLQSGPEFDVEGLPAVFHGFSRLLGSRRLPVKAGTIDSGDLVEAR